MVYSYSKGVNWYSLPRRYNVKDGVSFALPQLNLPMFPAIDEEKVKQVASYASIPLVSAGLLFLLSLTHTSFSWHRPSPQASPQAGTTQPSSSAGSPSHTANSKVVDNATTTPTAATAPALPSNGGPASFASPVTTTPAAILPVGGRGGGSPDNSGGSGGGALPPAPVPTPDPVPTDPLTPIAQPVTNIVDQATNTVGQTTQPLIDVVTP